MTQSEGKELPLRFDVVCNIVEDESEVAHADLEPFIGSRCCSCVEFDVFSNVRGFKEQR
jgi:hypothetical protein